jgi:hypothetical protein
MAFELFVLAALLWNTVDRPRQIDQTLAAALKRDGIMFYAVMTILRGIQLGLVSTLKPALLVLGGLFVFSSFSFYYSAGLTFIFNAASFGPWSLQHRVARSWPGDVLSFKNLRSSRAVRLSSTAVSV